MVHLAYLTMVLAWKNIPISRHLFDVMLISVGFIVVVHLLLSCAYNFTWVHWLTLCVAAANDDVLLIPVVHRQLLQADRPKKPMSVRPPPGFHREALETLPESGMISILHGEGLKGSHSGQESMSSVISPPKIPSSESIVTVSLTAEDEDGLYDNQQISKICDNLNQQNRMAKLSSFECQSLFLSLCFKDRSELTRAVVTNLRVNGFFAYVPRFDFRAPVFISDKDGNLQMDPELLKLSSSAGLPPSGGFTASPYARKFPSGRCTTVQDSTGNEMLEISVPDSSAKYFLKVLDVVTVTISCDDWNTKSRIPPPRIHWIADSRGSPRSGKNNRNNKAAERTEESKKSKNVTMTPIMSKVEPCKVSLYDEITRIETPAKLAVDVRTLQKYNRGELSGTSVIPGRLAFGGFVNPDTRSAQQEAAIHDASEAAMERRNQILASRARQSEFDTTKRIEKEVTARMQRLAVNKRNARIKGKGK